MTEDADYSLMEAALLTVACLLNFVGVVLFCRLLLWFSSSFASSLIMA